MWANTAAVGSPVIAQTQLEALGVPSTLTGTETLNPGSRATAREAASCFSFQYFCSHLFFLINSANPIMRTKIRYLPGYVRVVVGWLESGNREGREMTSIWPGAN